MHCSYFSRQVGNSIDGSPFLMGAVWFQPCPIWRPGTFSAPRLLSRISGELQEFYLSDRAYLLSSADLRKWRVSRGPKNDCQRKVGDEVVSDNRGLHGSARGFKMENESLVERHIDG